MIYGELRRLLEARLDGGLSRRDLLRTVGGGVALGVVGGPLLAACGGDDDDDDDGESEDSGSGSGAESTTAPPDDGATEVEDAEDEPTEASEDAGSVSDTSATIAQGVDASTLDPYRFGSQVDNNILYHVFDQLVWRGPDLAIEPMLAESWETVDELTWEFKLREGVTFHNGEEFNADAVQFSLERAADEELQPTLRFLNDVPLDKLEIIDPYTVRFITKTPHALMLDHLNEFMILPPGHYGSISPDDAALTPVGSGPYKFVEWVGDDHVTLTANADYWGGAPAIGELIWRPIPEASTRIAELETGGVDVITNVPPDNTEDVDAADGTRVEPVQGGRRIFIGINCAFEPFQDPLVRQALNHAVDVDTIIETILQGYGERMKTIANDPYKNPDLAPYAYDPDKAMQLLADAGLSDGLEIVMETPQGRYIKDRDVATAVASYLDQVGIKTTVEVVEWSVFLEKLRNRDTAPLFLLGLGAWFNGQDELRSVQYDDTYNATQWMNEEFEQTYIELQATFEDEERRQLSHKLQEIVYNDAPWIFLYKQFDLYGVSERLAWTPRADERMYFYNATISE